MTHSIRLGCTVQTIRDSIRIKAFITILVVVLFLLFPKVGFLPLGAEGFSITRCIVFPFCHANIFHLLCNLLCLWQMRSLRYYALPAFAVQFLCSLLPEQVHDIMGMSGFLFAVIGIHCGYHGTGIRMMRFYLPFMLVTAFIPNVATLFHFYCLVAGYGAGCIYGIYTIWKAFRIVNR